MILHLVIIHVLIPADSDSVLSLKLLINQAPGESVVLVWLQIEKTD
jgi:hypothetical protein